MGKVSTLHGFVGTSGYQCGWLASQADLLADDWEVNNLGKEK